MLYVDEVREKIHADLVAVRIVANDGIPDVPALARFRADFKTNPWTRMIYGHFVLISPDGRELLTGSGSKLQRDWIDLYEPSTAIKRFDRARHLWARFQSLRATNDDAAAARLRAEIDADIRRRYPVLIDRRIVTARVVVGSGPAPWDEVLDALRPVKPGETDKLDPELRGLARVALGELLVNEAPFPKEGKKALEAIYLKLPPAEARAIVDEVIKRKGTTHVTLADVGLPDIVMRRAAEGLGALSGQGWKADDPGVVARARAYWKEARQDRASRK